MTSYYKETLKIICLEGHLLPWSVEVSAFAGHITNLPEVINALSQNPESKFFGLPEIHGKTLFKDIINYTILNQLKEIGT